MLTFIDVSTLLFAKALATDISNGLSSKFLTSAPNPIEDPSVGVHNIHEPAVLQRVNAFVGSIGDREYLKPEAALADLAEKLGRIGIVFKDKVDLEGKSGTFSTGLTQHGGRFGKDIDGSDINDDGITHRLGRELKLKGRYETLENGSVRVYAELA